MIAQDGKINFHDDTEPQTRDMVLHSSCSLQQGGCLCSNHIVTTYCVPLLPVMHAWSAECASVCMRHATILRWFIMLLLSMCLVGFCYANVLVVICLYPQAGEGSLLTCCCWHGAQPPTKVGQMSAKPELMRSILACQFHA